MTTTTDTRYIASVTRAEDLLPGDVVQLTADGPKLTVTEARVAYGTNDNPCVGLAVTERADWLYLPLGTFVKVDTVPGPSGQEDPAVAAYHQLAYETEITYRLASIEETD